MSTDFTIEKQFKLGGIHHVTAITSSAQKIYDFMTNILGLRLAKKTVNQDDYNTFHLYFTDEDGNAGTDMTFFDFPNVEKGTKGTNNIERVSFRVPSDRSVEYWLKRFDSYDVVHGEPYDFFGKMAFDFEDFDGQLYRILSDENNSGMASGVPWSKSNVAKEHAITGLGTVTVTVANLEHMELVMTDILGFRKIDAMDDLTLYEVGEGGNGASVVVKHDPESQPAWQGYGNIHHLALRIATFEGLQYWIERLSSFRFPNSGFVDRFYFSSEYVQVAPQVLFEIATDTPGEAALEMAKSGEGKVRDYEEALHTSGFWIDETKEEAGIDFSLPPHLFPQDEAVKAATAAKLRPLDTSDADTVRA